MAHPWGKGRSLRGVLGPCRCPRSRGAVGARRSRRLLSLRDTARAMSQENVEVVRVAYDAFAREGLDRFMEHFTEDVDYHVLGADGLIHGPIHGKNGVRAWL